MVMVCGGYLWPWERGLDSWILGLYFECFMYLVLCVEGGPVN